MPIPGVTPTLRSVNAMARDLTTEDRCTTCGQPAGRHFQLVTGEGRRWIGCPTPPLTDGSIQAARAQQLADRTRLLATEIAILTDVALVTLPADEQARRLQQARRVLQEHDVAAEKVARHRAAQACALQIEILLYGHRRALSSGERSAAREIAGAVLDAYQMSLEGVADVPLGASNQAGARARETGLWHHPTDPA